MAQTKANDKDTWTETDDTWDEVESETQVKFDTIGDVFTGYLQSMDSTPTGITQAHLTGTREFSGEYFINCGRDLVSKLKKIPLRPGQKTEVRIELVDFMDTGQQSPMGVYKVQYKH
jgi:hypothetical protein